MTDNTDFLALLPKTIDYQLERYYLQQVYIDSTSGSVPKSEEIVKLYYKSQNKILKVQESIFLVEGQIYFTVYEMLRIIENNLRYVIVSSEEINDFKSYVEIINNLSSVITKLEIYIKKRGK
ncbi:hypothetical protein [Clostridium tertium]|uniref:hypothetical protein n=1 Tax=Clostridium tertium TaxID=1559 RepID=UPI0023B21BD1|nr:hypothetical protein [Clostridium tertium]